MRPAPRHAAVPFAAALFAAAALSARAAADAGGAPVIRSWGVPSGEPQGVEGECDVRVADAFRARHPGVRLEPAGGLVLPGGRAMDTTPLMQIAGDVAPDALYVNFRQSDTYVRNRFLMPLDAWLEREDGLAPEATRGAHALSNEEYLALLRTGPRFEEEMRDRLPAVLWDVIRRECPWGADCPYLRDWGREPCAAHRHVFAVPLRQLVTALFYRRDVFAEAGLPDRVPETAEEMLAWARRATNPAGRTWGLRLPTSETGYSTLSFLYSWGGRAVARGADGAWRCAFDSPEAADAYTFVARLYLEPFTNAWGALPTCVDTGEANAPGQRSAMWFSYLDRDAFSRLDPNLVGFGPVPRGPTGLRGSEYNCSMLGVYAGSGERDPRAPELAWEWAWFAGGREARAIRARTYVENGLGRFVPPSALREAGFEPDDFACPPGWEETAAVARENGIPEPYGRNCQLVYAYMSRAIDQARNDGAVRAAIRRGDFPAARGRIASILRERVALADEKMIGRVPPEKLRFRRRVAAAAVAGMALVFVLVFRRVLRTFAAAVPRDPAGGPRRDGAGRGAAYLLLLPALLSLAVWSYWPLARGTAMAFQDYNVRGWSRWVGLDNFAAVLFSGEFWHAMLVSLEYAALYLSLGFVAPIVLALLLSEVPRGKILYRTVYYLPAVLSGVVVIFLWKGFYGPYGALNQMLNGCIHAVNAVFGTSFPDLAKAWLSEPKAALLLCLLPTIWAGMGPGCLVYLAALKTVPDDLYEAAELEGCGLFGKIRHVSLPSIRALVLINFVGAAIGAMKSGGEFVLAMTGGGPYAPYGATEVVGLHIFWEAFGYLRFGPATAMAWVLGSMLIGFTVLQLQRLSKMEFKAGAGAAATR